MNQREKEKMKDLFVTVFLLLHFFTELYLILNLYSLCFYIRSTV